MLKVSVYAENPKEPVMNISLLELTRIKNSFLSQIVLSVNLCDGCSDDSVSIIFTDEESFTVTSALKSLSMIKAGYSIITASGKDLSRRLGLLSSAFEDNCKDSFSTENSSSPKVQERRDMNDDDNHNLRIESIETVAKRDSISQSINENINVCDTADAGGDSSRSKDFSVVDKSEFTNGVRCSNGSHESEKAKNRNLSTIIDAKLKIVSPKDSTPRRKAKLMKESHSSNDFISGGYSLADIEDIDCCIKCKMDNGYGAMIQCYGCRKWWHYHCAGLEESDDFVSRYKCLKCRNKFKKLANTKYRESSDQENVDQKYETEVPKSNYSEVQQSNSKCKDGSQHSKTKHKCRLCKTLYFDNKRKLYMHYYSKHFKAEILAHIDGSRCKLCGYENAKRQDLIRHVASCNDLIGQLLHGGEIVKKKCPEIVKKKEKNIKCPLCIVTFEKEEYLRTHLSHVHFKSQLLEYVNSERLECLLCGVKNFSDNFSLLRHVGSVHGKNKEFLDENANRQINHSEESSKLKPMEKGSDEVLEKTLQEDLNLSSSSIEDLIMSDDEQ